MIFFMFVSPFLWIDISGRRGILFLMGSSQQKRFSVSILQFANSLPNYRTKFSCFLCDLQKSKMSCFPVGGMALTSHQKRIFIDNPSLRYKNQRLPPQHKLTKIYENKREQGEDQQPLMWQKMPVHRKTVTADTTNEKFAYGRMFIYESNRHCPAHRRLSYNRSKVRKP